MQNDVGVISTLPRTRVGFRPQGFEEHAALADVTLRVFGQGAPSLGLPTSACGRISGARWELFSTTEHVTCRPLDLSVASGTRFVMTRTEFGLLASLWGWWTFFEAVWIAVLWRSRTRVLGAGVYRTPGARRIWRRACERRIEALLTALERAGVPAEGTPDRDDLTDRWHRIVLGRWVSVTFQMVPLLVVVFPFWWATSIAPSAVTPLWMFAAVAGFGAVSITLMAADERATAVSDAAGVVTVESIRFLEMLLMPDGRRAQDSALEVHGRVSARLCSAIRAQARYGTFTMPPAIRFRTRQATERLVAALEDGNHRYLFGEGPDRDKAVLDLSRLVSGVLRQSCRPRAQRDSLVVIDSVLLVDTPDPSDAAGVVEPLRSRLLAGAGRLAVAVGLLAGAFLFPGGGAAADLLGIAGVATVALVCPPVREALQRAKEFFGTAPPGDGQAEAVAERLSPAASPPSVACSHCAGSSGSGQGHD
ncbi:hypothetical protein [Streptomyces sp. 049-1]|uniref:hypothetical protein n=1 Tax=Streptomyces sp. 049-1 TaxID=2789264 RepID=UPI00397F3CA2